MAAIGSRILAPIAVSLALFFVGVQSAAFEISGSKWKGGKTDFYVSLTGESPSGIAWHDSFLAAIADWDDDTVFDFNVIEQAIDPCLEDGLNSVDFTDEVCGSEYGASTLAVTLRRLSSTLLGEPNIFEADIVINSDVRYDIYDGLLYPGSNRRIDFRRVAIHELGHVIGLEHESRELAIMAPTIGDIDRPTEDDFAGVDALYTAFESCTQNTLVLGTRSNSLADGDCTVAQITAGGTDFSYIDLYRIDLEKAATLSLTMTSSALDSVLLISDLNLTVIDYDDKSVEGCSSTLTRQLDPGSYLVLANTFDKQVDPACVTEGDYSLTAHYQSGYPLPLGAAISTSDTPARGIITGAASNSSGAFYQTRFSADESIKVNGEIAIAAQDIGEAGFVVAAALTGDQVFALNSAGIFVERANNASPFPKHRTGKLRAIETVLMLDAVIPESLGITELDVDFLLGYGLDSDPSTIFYNSTPIKMVIEPSSP